jgi:hypothetical protein
MAPATDDTNPYKSPTAPSEPAATASSPPPPRRFRWRVIPVALLYIYGGSLVVSGVISVPFIVWVTILRGENSPLRDDLHWLLPGYFGMTVLGCLFLFAGRSLWHGRWKRGIIASAAAFALYGGAIATAQFLGLIR